MYAYTDHKGKEVCIGKINLQSYKTYNRKLTIVPLGISDDYDAGELKEYLDDIYQGALATFEVDIDPTWKSGTSNWQALQSTMGVTEDWALQIGKDVFDVGTLALGVVQASKLAVNVCKTAIKGATKASKKVPLSLLYNIQKLRATGVGKKLSVKNGEFDAILYAKILSEEVKIATFSQGKVTIHKKVPGVGTILWSDVLKQIFLNKIGKGLPENWNKFSLENNIEFAERLKIFRGNSDLTFNPKLRGGEGQLFKSPLKDDLVMKRWFGKRVKDMPESIRLLKRASDVIETTPKLNKIMDVVSVREKGSDWIIRSFDVRSIPLKNVVSNPVVAKVRQEAIDILSKQSGVISASILKKLNNNSANIHWSDVSKKILIIDML